MIAPGPASLPMYDFPDARAATDAWWAGLAEHLRRQGVEDAPPTLLRRDDLIDQWRDPRLVISQTCGYLLSHDLRSDLQPVATPHYTAPGCDGPLYASVILARDDHPGAQIADFAGAVGVYSRTYSHAGYNAFRGLVAPLAGAKPFFSRVIASGSHLDSIAALVAGQADLATIDCVVYAFVQRWRPSSLIGARSLGFTAKAPAPPYVAPIAAPADRMARLRAGLGEAMADPRLSSARDDLFIGGFSWLALDDYEPISALQCRAIGLGYPELS